MDLCAPETSVGEIQWFTVVFLLSTGIWINQKGQTVFGIYKGSTETKVECGVYLCAQ